MSHADDVECRNRCHGQELVAGKRLRSLIPVLDVRDVDASIEFYCDVLGFVLHDKVEWGGRTEWAVLRSENVQLMLCASQNEDVDEDSSLNEGVFFLYHDNPESLLVCLGAKGYTNPAGLLQTNAGMHDFFLRDPDGYVLWFSRKPLTPGQSESAA